MNDDIDSVNSALDYHTEQLRKMAMRGATDCKEYKHHLKSRNALHNILVKMLEHGHA